MTDSSQLPILLVVEDDEGLQRQLKWAYDGYQVICAGGLSFKYPSRTKRQTP